MSDPAPALREALSGRYDIERELGQGGMATVYLARDLKHGRNVALKVLRPELAAVLGGERFVAEIRTTASLQHPHILPLFDSDTAAGFLYYVMPWIEGETLRDKLNRETQLGVEEAVRITKEIADALDYAHRHGVVHRDIKPENILLHDGRAMVADFGIALALSAAAGGRMTETGLSLGTPHYMSPEQATGEKDIGPRSDVYSLAVVLYEMLTGNPPHVGSSAQQIIMKIVTEEAAALTRLRKSVPPNVAGAVAKALEKLPADRFESVKGFSDALANPAFRFEGTTVGAAAIARAAPGKPWRLQVSLALNALLAAALVGVLISGPGAPAPEARAVSSVLALPEGERVAGHLLDDIGNAERPSRTALAFSPDGGTLVYLGERAGVRSLFLRPLSSETSTPIPGTEGAESPFFSPDGSELAFLARGSLWRMPLAGGPATEIADVGRVSGADWSPDGRIAYGSPEGVVMLSVNGGQPPATVGEASARSPRFLPDGEHVLFTRYDPIRASVASVRVVSTESGETRVLVENAADGRYLPTGHLLFARDGVMMAAPFDAGRLEVTGASAVVKADVMQALNGRNTLVLTGAMQAAVSSNGHLAFLTGGITPDRAGRVVWLDRQGRRTPIDALGAAPFFAVRIAPDGTRLAVTLDGAEPDTRIFDIARGTRQGLPGSGQRLWPLWSPDGERVLTAGLVGDSLGLVMTTSDGSGAPEPFAVGVIGSWPAFWSPEGDEVFLVSGGRGVDAVGVADGSVRHIEGFPGGPLSHPALSPDGRWLAYRAFEPGSESSEVYVQPWPSLDGRWRVSLAGGGSPVWSRGGRELLYLEPTREDGPLLGPVEVRVMAVEVGDAPDFSRVVPRPLFTATFQETSPVRGWDVSADGSRFVVAEPGEVVSSPPGDIHLVLNWFSELRRLVGQGGG